MPTNHKKTKGERKIVVKGYFPLSYNEGISIHSRNDEDTIGKVKWHMSISEDKETAVWANAGQEDGVVECEISYVLPNSKKK